MNRSRPWAFALLALATVPAALLASPENLLVLIALGAVVAVAGYLVIKEAHPAGYALTLLLALIYGWVLMEPALLRSVPR